MNTQLKKRLFLMELFYHKTEVCLIQHLTEIKYRNPSISTENVKIVKMNETIFPIAQLGVGDLIIVKPTHIIAVGQFYGRIACGANGAGFKELHSQMQSMKFDKLKKMPKIGDKVLTRREKNFRRAIIVQMIDNTNCKLFYIDNGFCSTVRRNELFKHKVILDEYPPFAVHFSINRLNPCFYNDVPAIVAMKQMLLVNKVEVKIVGIHTDDQSGETIFVADVYDINNLKVARMLGRKRFGIYERKKQN